MSNLLTKNIAIFVCILHLIFPYQAVYGDEFNSPSFQIKEPVINPSGFGSSSNFQLYGVLAQPSAGESTASNYEVRAGFLYFPFASAPTPSASAGDSQVSLSWSASSGFLGWTISSYTIGRSTTPGGTYTYSSVGNTLSSTIGSLSNGTAYYFVIRAQDYFGNFVATSSEVSATPIASAVGGGGGGGNGPIITSISYIPRLDKTPETKECSRIADLNCDGYVDIVDFSIMYYWFEKSNPPIRADLKKDNKVDIYDFSVMAYHWYERYEN